MLSFSTWLKKPQTKEQARDAEWHYLTSPNAQARYELATRYVSHLPHVLEIGAYKTPIDRYLAAGSACEWVRVIDPVMPAFEGKLPFREDSRVEHIPAFYQNVNHAEFIRRPYAMVLIGCSLKFNKRDSSDKGRALGILRGLLEGASTVVYEYPVNWPNAIENADFVRGILGKPRVDLALNIGHGIKMDSRMADRRFLVF